MVDGEKTVEVRSGISGRGDWVWPWVVRVAGADVGVAPRVGTSCGEPMNRQLHAQQKLVARLVGQARWLEREQCSWELVRFVRTVRGTHVDVERHTSDGADLFGLLATMIVWRDHVHLPVGKVELRWSQGKRAARVAVRVWVGR